MTPYQRHTAMQLLRIDRTSNARYRCEICKVEITAHARTCRPCGTRKKTPVANRELATGAAARGSQSVADLSNYSTTRVGVSASGEFR
jgi:hypothetical protein